MPLPAALAAKLAKRGIISSRAEPANQEEEVIAESYDSPSRLDEFGNPLPPSWEKVWAADRDTWYYWDTDSDRVSWLPPSDPDAVITEPASKTAFAAPPSVERREERRTKRREHGKKARFEDDFDPMDPSSYSDAPKGDWRAGLKKVNDAKTGVDSTASGPLFQQRPYPSPGEVLSRNKAANRDYGPVKPK